MSAVQIIDPMQQLGEYWRSLLPADGGLPDRRDVGPNRQIANLLPHLILMEVTKDDVVFRLVGTGHSARVPHDITGRRYGDYIGAERIARGVKRAGSMIQYACGARVLVRERYERERQEEVIMNCLPLIDGKSGAPFILAHAGTTLALEELLQVEGPFLTQPFAGFEFVDLGFGLPPADIRARDETPFPEAFNR